MRISQNLFQTFKESPADAELISHQLMLRAGLIQKLGSGLYTWLPLGLRVLRKIERIIREEMNRIGAEEILMPIVQPMELWQESGRWDEYGPLLLKVIDRQKRAFCIAPTHEEVITDLARRLLKSYKQLPRTLYQIQIKFRDEIRPRFGVLRAREFVMKDAYSFHLDLQSLQQTYAQMYEAYSQILKRLGLRFCSVLADTGNIGGSVSHEFQVLAESGEDLIVHSDSSDYAANIECAERLVSTEPRPAATHTLQTVTTPGLRTVEAQVLHLGLSPSAMLKTLIVRGRSAAHPFVALLIRGDHTLNPLKAEKHPWVASPLCMAEPEDLARIAHCGPGFIGPKDLGIPLIADPDAAQMANFVCGANQEDQHYAGFNWDRDAKLDAIVDLRLVQSGDPSPDGQGHLQLSRGIEVGHIFQLGDKYSTAMRAQVLNEQGQNQTLLMGCYGIGVSRIVGAAIEQHHDTRGIVWPAAIAPFQVILIPIQYHRSEQVRTATDTLYQSLLAADIEVLLDDRDERLGVMLSDAELIGIPHQIIISEKNLANNQLEYKSRANNHTKMIQSSDCICFLKQALDTH